MSPPVVSSSPPSAAETSEVENERKKLGKLRDSVHVHLHRVSWVQVPPEAARKSDCFGCAVLLCLVVCLTLLASFFLIDIYMFLHVYTCI